MQAIQLETPEGTEVFEDARSSPPKKSCIDATSNVEHDKLPSRSKSSTPGYYLFNLIILCRNRYMRKIRTDF